MILHWYLVIQDSDRTWETCVHEYEERYRTGPT